MEWIFVIAFILLGIGLIVVEVVLIPGTTFVGFLGFCLAVAGVIMSFRYFGESIGWITLTLSAVASGGMLYWSLRTGAWKRFSLKESIDSKVNEGALDNLQEGAEGVAVSSLRPIGKAEVAGRFYEVRTQGEFVESGTKIKVIKIVSNQIIVKSI